MLNAAAAREARTGATLVELAVVIVIIGVLAGFGVPRFIKSVERAKAEEAFTYLSAVREAQERYRAREGTYSNEIEKIDIKASAPKYFTVGTLAATGDGSFETTWTLTLTRLVPSAGYGRYTVTFNQDGYDATSGIDGFPEINPMWTDPAAGSTGAQR